MAKPCRVSVEKCRIRRRIQQDPIAKIFQEFLFSLDRSHIFGSRSAQDPTADPTRIRRDPLLGAGNVRWCAFPEAPSGAVLRRNFLGDRKLLSICFLNWGRSAL